jgi:hypothetical protein
LRYWLWERRNPAAAPWAPKYVGAFAALVDGLASSDLAAKQVAVPTDPPEFRYSDQAARAEAFIHDLTVA